MNKPSSSSGSVPLFRLRSTELGMIPQDWEIKPLGALGTFMKGKGIKRDDVSDDGLACVRYGELYTDYNDYIVLPKSRIPRAVAETSTPIKYGDLLFAGSGETAEEIGKCAAFLSEEEAYAGGDLVVLRPIGQNPLYLGHLLNHQVIARQKARLGQGDAVVHISARNLGMVKVPLPPNVSEQNSIAEVLSDVDELLWALENMIAKKQVIKQAAMQKLLTGDTRLPGFTGKWETKRIGDISTCLPTANNPRADLSERGDVEYIHYGDVHAHAQPVMDCSRANLPRINKDRIGGAAQLQNGDLVLVDASEDLVGVGKSVEVQGLQDRNVVAGLHTILCRGNPEHWAMGFNAYLQFIPAFKTALTRVATGISVYAISKKQVADVELPLPLVPEQKAIVAVLADMDAEIDALERRRDKIRQIKQGMMQQLLTGRIRLVKPEAQAPATQAEADGKATKPHSWAFNEAVVISTLAKHFGKEDFPLGRKRYTKLSYLLHRHTERQVEGYLKKAAGPYNPKTKYGGPERIALESDYIREHKNGPYTGFVASDNIAQAEAYFEKWYGADAIKWLDQFRFKKNDDLELLATVDMAAEELRAGGQEIDVHSVKAVIRSHPEWKAKLDRAVFSDANIAAAIEAIRELFAERDQDNFPGGT